MKLLSLTQPYATLVAVEEKHIETRSWHPRWDLELPIPVAIHAAMTFPRWARALLAEPAFYEALKRHGYHWSTPEQFPRGAILAVAEIVEVASTIYRVDWAPEGRNERAFGDYSPGRWMWRLANVRRLAEPLDYPGALGLRNLPPEVEARVLAALPA